METIESLIKQSPVYHMEHIVQQSDVDKANKIIEVIEKSRNDKKPMPGDILELTNKYGDYYHAHIENDSSYMPGHLNVCEQPYVPFVWVSKTDNTFHCNTSGGAWPQIPADKVKYIGKRTKYFKDWGHCGGCGNGAFTFKATVNVWEYIAEDRLYGDYTTKDWQKRYFYFFEDGKKSKGGYKITGDYMAFKDLDDYNLWLRTYKGVEFTAPDNKCKWVFYYKEIEHLISRDKWEELELPIDTRMCNGIIAVKVKYDDEKHTIDTYRFTNDGHPLWNIFKPYEYNFGNNNNFESVIKKVLSSLRLNEFGSFERD